MIDAIDRILPRLQIESPGPLATSCWTFLGSISSEGYGRVLTERRTQGGHKAPNYTHRVLYEWAYEPIPPGHELDHLCRRRACCRPDHLEPVSHRVNTLRGESPGAIAVRLGVCRRGHPRTAANGYERPDGQGRMCRLCWELRHRAYRSTANARRRERRTTQRAALEKAG